MKQLKLLCSYEEWKQKKVRFTGMSEETGRLLNLAFNFHRTEAEEKEYELLSKKTHKDSINEKYTNLTYEITDMYNKLKDIHEDDMRHEIYEDIGRKQCEIEILREEKE